jgi:PAS domain S-box-containing protein
MVQNWEDAPVSLRLVHLAWVKELTEGVGLVSAVIGGSFALVALTRRVWQASRKAAETHERLMKLADTFTPEVIANLTTIAAQLRPNGGASLADKLGRIEKSLIRSDELRRQQMNATGLAFWEADASGLTVYTSDAAAALEGVAPDKSIGNGWVTNVVEEERGRVFAEWLAAVAQHRAYSAQHTYLHADGTRHKVQVHAHPLSDGAGSVLGFVGILTPIR